MKFVKIHGIGNDYIFINGFEEKLVEKTLPDLARKMSKRHFGIGSDGIILILPSKKADFKMRIFNADGSEAEMCGNGIRGFAKYVHEKGLTDKKEITVETLAGIIKPTILKDKVKVDMGEPILDAAKIPTTEKGQLVDFPLEVDNKCYHITTVSMGNPHAVVFVESFNFDVADVGSAIENHPLFPKKTNVEFIEIINDKELGMQVWERGSGVTLACGTGACAAAVASVLNKKSGRRVTVHLIGGDLDIEWNEKDNHVYMTGPAEIVFEGEWKG
ncbi:MAG: diaminopimelate epimerase [Candidatus Woesearchaeota archaeon]|jgi:diaminopimelate epimerase|nr:diaminopimelate epimerase [Candidatus Woesearchaeota archaeon]MDP7323937.1 diaminopimelate epimerase [Candidatus Woesearchaeota archaeon]